MPTRNSAAHAAVKTTETESLFQDTAAPKGAVLSAELPKTEHKIDNAFAAFGLPAKLMQSISRMNFTTPTPVQAAAIPLAMQGRDILGSAQTGTGKTGAFGIPLVAKLMEQEFSNALIMTPTRELAAQVADMLQQLVPVPNIKLAVLIGGEAMPKQFRQLSAKPRIVVGTPGRINDHLRRGTLSLKQTSFLVLDETDRMLDMGFGPQLDEIMKFMPSERQTMLFSATLPSNIVQLSKKYLTNPERVAVGSLTSPITKIKQETISVIESQKYEQLMTELENRKGSIIIFAKTKFGAQRMADKLVKEGHQADAIHGDLQQRKRDRVIADFRDKRFRILVATDVAARGLDIPHIAHVINYDLPQVAEDYIHRIGRTARAGAEGSAVNFVTSADGAKWRAIQRLIGGQTSVMETGQGSGRGRGARSGGGNGGAYESKRPFKGARTPDGERNYGPKKSYGERKFGAAARPAGERTERAERTDRPAKPWGKRTERAEGAARKPYAAKPYGDRAERSNTPRGRADDAPRGKTFGKPAGKSFGKSFAKAGGKPAGKAKMPQSTKNKGKPVWAS